MEPRHLVQGPARLELAHDDRLHHRRRHCEPADAWTLRRKRRRWSQVTKVFSALFWSPVIGFGAAFILFFVFKFVARDPRLYKAPEGTAPPPFWIRCLLILTCGGVSYAHGSNDGQKGMGLIMLILVGTVPTAYALNHAVGRKDIVNFAAVSAQTSTCRSSTTSIPTPPSATPSPSSRRFVSTHKWKPETTLALSQEITDIRNEAVNYGSLSDVPASMQANVRNQMYLASEAIRLMPKYGPKMSAADAGVLSNYRSWLDKSTKFIPTWVKVAVALALGMGTMIGWKRIVVTVGEKIGKTHMTYAQGASAEIITMATILGADHIGVPVSYDPHSQLRRRGHDGRQPQRPAALHRARHRAGVGLHAARRRAALRLALSGSSAASCTN